MRIALLVFVFLCLICSTVALFWDREVGPSGNAWSRPVRGIQMMIYTTRPICKAGQQYDIRLRLRNPGSHRRVLGSSTYVTDKCWTNGTLQGERIGDMKLCEEPDIVIEPGQVRDVLYSTERTARAAVHGFEAHSCLFGRIGSNRATTYVIPENGFWLAAIALQLAGVYLLLRRKRRTADDQAS